MSKQNSIKSFFSGAGGGTLKKQKTDTASVVTAVARIDAPLENESIRAPTQETNAPPVVSSKDAAGSSIPNLFLTINDDWKRSLANELKKPYIQSLEQYVQREYKSATVYPPKDLIFSALNTCHYDDLKVVIIGQDPYHGPHQAHGLCFSVQRGIPPPPSLKNIFKELKSDVGFRVPNHGYLAEWSSQGVLMLNTTLTVRQGEPNSHAKRGWEEFTDAVIREIAKKEGIVFLLWGKPAQNKCEFIDRSKHRVITSSHPSPLGATKTAEPFIGSRCFSRCNAYLVELGKSPIDWKLSP